MADVTILNSELIQDHPGQRGYSLFRGVAQFNGTDATDTLPLLGIMNFVDCVELTPAQAPGAMAENIQLPLGTISATASFIFQFPKAGTVTAASFTTKDTTTASDTNFWQWNIVNKGQAGSGTTKIVDSTNDLNSTKATGGINAGGGLTGYVASALTLAAAGNLVVVAGDVAELTITKNSAATNMTESLLRVTVSLSNSADEGLYWADTLVSGKFGLSLTSRKVTIGRKANAPTSNFKFNFAIWGR